jgi:hypothetical protein
MLKKFIVFLLLSGAIIYIGILFGTPQYRYHAFKSDIEELSVLQNMQLKEIREEVKEAIDYYGVPIKMSSVLVEKLPNYQYRIKVSWKETVNLLDFYEKTYQFSIDEGL